MIKVEEGGEMNKSDRTKANIIIQMGDILNTSYESFSEFRQICTDLIAEIKSDYADGLLTLDEANEFEKTVSEIIRARISIAQSVAYLEDKYFQNEGDKRIKLRLSR
jgi:hypothetical protein